MDKVEARLQIERIIYRYAEAIDTGNLGALEDIFRRGCIRVEGQQSVITGGEAVKNLIQKFTAFYDNAGQSAKPDSKDISPFTRHITSNLYFEKLEGAEAITRSYFTVVQALPGTAFQPIISGRYRDTFYCEKGEWFLVERYEIMDLFGDLSRHLNQNPF